MSKHEIVKYFAILNVIVLVVVASIALTWSERYGYHKCLKDRDMYEINKESR